MERYRYLDPEQRRRMMQRERRRRRRVFLVSLGAGLAVALGALAWLAQGGAGLAPQGGPPEGQVFPLGAASQREGEPGGETSLSAIEIPSWVEEALLDLGGSRTGEKLEEVNAIAVHYVGNPGTSAAGNRNYFNTPGVEVNAHFVIGLEGEILQCVPLDEKSAATNERNRDTISIEVCHPDETGEFTSASYESLVKLCAWLCRQLGLDEGDLIRHYDVTGKECPLYFVQHEDAWEQFKADVGAALAQG